MKTQLSRRHLIKSLPMAALAGSFNIHVCSQEAKKLWVTGNPVIDKAREIALGLLRPTQAQLENAWELHFGSVVFESYGFAPRCAVDAEAMNEAVTAGASAAELSDLRESMTMNRNATNERERKEFLEAFQAAGVTCIFQNTGEEGNDPMRLIKRLAHFTKATDLMKPALSKVVTAEEIVALKKAGHVGLCFTTNGVPLRMDWESVRDELRYVRIFQELGVRMMHLTYNRRNPIGDGAGEPHDGGLSDFGQAAVAEMNKLGVIVDVAHSGWKTALDAAKASSKPMVASHTTCCGVYEHFRGKPDDTIKAICDTDGLVGICCISRFLGGKGDVTAMMDHLDHLIKKFGSKHAAIGCDVAYTSRFDKEERAKLLKAPAGSADKWEHLWPKDDYVTTIEAEQSVAWSNWPLFTLGMIMRGHSDEVIQKVIGGNMLRVLKANAI
ncbi:MAG: membrane dipeptidase [Verrucomicrobia bacterium]|nr:membrane dipeptidase [Verrucomicrobiota bacterium]